MRNIIRNLSVFIASAIGLALVSCQKPPQPPTVLPGEGGHRLFLYYAAGQNSLKGFITEDIQELAENYLPLDREADNVVLMYVRTAPESYLIRLHRNQEDKAELDTLTRYGAETNAADPATLNKILSEVQERFPDRKYGMLFSSHASGWLPKGYYGNESKFESGNIWNRRPQKSIGQDAVDGQSFEMDLKEFAKAIPMHMDYIVFDACLMGGIEVAYELRYVCDQIGFSQTEILADGFNYKKIIRSLFMTPKDYAERICRDYFEQYEAKSGWERSATISLVKTREIEEIARICRFLNTKYRKEIGNLQRSTIQRYYRYNYDYFFDLKDIYVNAGAETAELEQLQEALDACIIYMAATEEFMYNFSGFKISNFSGFSMYLPSNQKYYLNDYYKTLEWNIATELVK